MNPPLKLIKAYIQPHMLERAVAALKELPVAGLSVNKLEGFGRGVPSNRQTSPFVREFHPKVGLEILCGADEADAIVETLCQAAHTGRPGDGLVFVQPVESMHRIREHG